MKDDKSRLKTRTAPSSLIKHWSIKSTKLVARTNYSAGRSSGFDRKHKLEIRPKLDTFRAMFRFSALDAALSIGESFVVKQKVDESLW